LVAEAGFEPATFGL